MKQKLFILLFSFIATISISQEYTSFVETGTKFSIGMCSGGNPNPTHTNYEIIGEDTIINDIIYQKLYETAMDVEFYSSMTLIGFIRETEDRQVFLRDLDGEEGLYYDFYVEKGDSIDFYNPFIKYFYQSIFPELGPDTVAVVDTVYYSEINGVNRKVYEVSAYGDFGMMPLQFIEGIGAITGIKYCGQVNFFGTVGAGWIMLCAYNNDGLFYQNETYSSCFITNIQNDYSNAFVISPNPCNDMITCNNPLLYQYNIKMFNLSGRLIFETNTNKSSLTYNTQHLPSGMYIVSINTGYQIQHHKLIKQ